MAGGGKGDSTTSEMKLPPEVEKIALANLYQAQKAGTIGYVPYQGPTVIAPNAAQQANFKNNQGMASAFGLQSADPMAGLPKMKTYAGGIQGYDPLALYNAALKKIPKGQRKAIEAFVMNPNKPPSWGGYGGAIGKNFGPPPSGGGGGGGGGGGYGQPTPDQPWWWDRPYSGGGLFGGRPNPDIPGRKSK